jgi:hypothetical protein
MQKYCNKILHQQNMKKQYLARAVHFHSNQNIKILYNGIKM